MRGRIPHLCGKGGADTGPSPVDRRKTGSKHHLICDGHGIPLHVITTAANVNDITQTFNLIDGIPPVAGRPGRPRRRPESVLGDKAYDSRAVRRELQRRRIMPVTLVFFCHAWTLWLYLSWLPSFFVGSYGIDLKSSALYTSAVFFAGVVGDTAGGLLTDWLYRRTGKLNESRRNVIILGFGGTLLFLCCVMYFHDQTIVTLCLAAALFLLEMAEGPIWAVPMDVAPRYAGIAGGFVSTAAGVAAMISPAAFGYITDLSGSYKPPFILSIGLLFIGIVLSFRIRADLALQEPPGPQPPLNPIGVPS